MSDFKAFRNAVNEQFSLMAKHDLFAADIDKDTLWGTYLLSFPEGTNPIYKTNTEHDCTCCRQFIKNGGGAVAIIDGVLVSIWDINIGGTYQVVADALSAYVRGAEIRNVYLHFENSLGADHTLQNVMDEEMAVPEVKSWDHFHFKLPTQFVNTQDRGPVLGEALARKNVLKRSLNDLTLESAETVLELIAQKSLYKGDEYKSLVKLFVKHKKEYDEVERWAAKDNFCWVLSKQLGAGSKIRNTVIGTLLDDLSNEVELNKAVKSFEDKVAPQNYKRPTALVTPGMIKKAEEKVIELGFSDSLQRRYAVTDDLTINNVLFADRSVKKQMSVFDEMAKECSVSVDAFDKVEEISVEDFINEVVPTATKLELLVENKHNSNFMSLIAPVNDAPNILKWNNNFSWTYQGEVTDSMKERVKAAGGSVTGDLRFSIQWNDKGDNKDDLDAHCHEPNGNVIMFSSMKSSYTKGVLDVDITQPGGNVAVENITWPNRNCLLRGDYQLLVHNYAARGASSGFSAQVEFDGVIHEFSYARPLTGQQKVKVAKVSWDGSNFTIAPDLESNLLSRETWGVTTQNFHTVRMLMNSPNHWDGQTSGNKHWFFILEDCKNDEKARGFYNEFLKPELIEHRKVFEVLGSKMKTEESDDQLSGLGFSSTQRNSVLCKVTGRFARTIKINF